MRRETWGSNAQKEAAAEMKHNGKQKSQHTQARKFHSFFTSYKSNGPEETKEKVTKKSEVAGSGGIKNVEDVEAGRGQNTQDIVKDTDHWEELRTEDTKKEAGGVEEHSTVDTAKEVGQEKKQRTEDAMQDY